MNVKIQTDNFIIDPHKRIVHAKKEESFTVSMIHYVERELAEQEIDLSYIEEPFLLVGYVGRSDGNNFRYSFRYKQIPIICNSDESYMKFVEKVIEHK